MAKPIPSHAIRIHETGGVDVLRWEKIDVPTPAEGEVQIRQTAVGLNYIDVYYRTGLYKASAYPMVLGLEGAGVITELGAGVTGFKVGDRVAYGGGPLGAYAEIRNFPAKFLVPVPDGVSDEVAASLMVQGATAQFLLRRTFPLQAGQTCLIHAAAGGVGLLLCQWAKHLGATVIGTVSTETKAELAKANGCEHIIRYTEQDVVKEVQSITDGKGVHVVFDSVGRDTFSASLDCLKPLGMMVSYGQASGAIPPFEISQLAAKGSLFLTRPSLMHYMLDTELYLQGIRELFDLTQKNVIKTHIGQRYALSEAAKAHNDLEARKTHGSTVLLVG